METLSKGSKGRNVLDAKYLMNGHNVFGIDTFKGDLKSEVYGQGAEDAARSMKYKIGYSKASINGTFGNALLAYLTGKKKRGPLMVARAKARAQKEKAGFHWPLGTRGKLIGFPGVGTHSYSSPPNNWESDRAWDISVPVGTTVLAMADGVIGSQIGPLPDPGSRFHGIRLHLVFGNNEAYYAHLSTLAVRAGQHVKKGQQLGHSGEANGVAHLHIGIKNGNPLNLPGLK
jgi:murein DD-endopeptidase MepM/ murein hydrolase activator NlpD